MSHRPTAALIAAALLAPLALAGGDDREALARDLLEQGFEKAADGHYDQALDDYGEVVRKYAGTAAARVAERRLEPNALLGWADIQRSGDSANRVDVIIMGDGYTLKHLDSAFHSRAEDVVDAFERNEVLEEYLSYFNFIRAATVSEESNVDGHGREYDTALEGYFTNTAGPAFAAVKPERVRAFLEQMPAHDDFAFAIVRSVGEGESRPGVATIGGATRDMEQITHAFGHGYVGLGDEFPTTNQHRFPSGARPNLSSSETDVPWQHWIEAGHKSVGVYEGASGRVSDIFRPVASKCLMNDARQFGPVCREAVVLAVYSRVDPIESSSPEPIDRASDATLVPELEQTATVRYQPMTFEVTTMQPASHDLEVTWWVVAEHRAPRSSGVRLSHAERARRGPLPEIEPEPVHRQRKSRDGRYELVLDPRDLEPGRYRVVARARDTTELRGERHPWVLEDPQGLLESERAWWIEIPANRR